MGDKPPYQPEAWDTKTDNCYEYAVAGSSHGPDASIANPGTTHGWDFSQLDIEKATMITLVQRDGLEPAGDNLPPEKAGHYRVAMYLKTYPDEPGRNDYHFIREDENGLWSQKQGKNSSVETVKDAAGNPVKEVPTLMEGYQATVEAGEGTYKLSHYFYVPAQGLDVGWDAFIERQQEQGKEAVCKAAEVMKHPLASAGVAQSLPKALQQQLGDCPDSKSYFR